MQRLIELDGNTERQGGKEVKLLNEE